MAKINIMSLIKVDNIESLAQTGVYFILNKTTKKFYIGSTNTPEGFIKRFREHFNDLQRKQHHSFTLQKSWNKTKDISSTWEFRILEVCSGLIVLQKEQEYLDTFLYAQEYINSDFKDRRFKNLGYNISPLAGVFYCERKSKKIYQYSIKGIFIKEWINATEICNVYGCDRTNIYKSCRIQSSCYGYLWSYLKQDIITILEKRPRKKQCKNTPRYRKIYMYNTVGTLEKVFNSYYDIEEYFKKHFSGIHINRYMIGKRMLKNNSRYKNFIWKHTPNITDSDIENNVILFKNNVFVNVYKNITTVFKTHFGNSAINWNKSNIVKFKDYILIRRKHINYYTDINKYLNVTDY